MTVRDKGVDFHMQVPPTPEDRRVILARLVRATDMLKRAVLYQDWRMYDEWAQVAAELREKLEA